MLYRTSIPYGGHRSLKALLTVLSLSILCILTATALCRAELVDRIVAVVNDDIILLSDLELAMTSYGHMLKNEGYTDAQSKRILDERKNEILEQLITEKLIEQKARQNGINVKADDVEANMERFIRFKGLTGDKLDRYLEMEGMTRASLRKQIRDQLLQRRLVDLEVRSKIVVTDEDVKAYYDENKDQYQGKTNYHLRHILMKVPGTGVAEKDRVRQLTQQIHQRLEDGESFAALAKVYSQSPTAEDGGDLGFFEIRHLAPVIRDALAKMKAGQFSPVLDTEQGFQIFYIEEISGTETKTMEMVKPEIQEILFSDMVKEKFDTWLKGLRQKAHIEILE